jgi:hypothetical protein
LYVLDEPTVGRTWRTWALIVLHRLVDAGNTVMVTSTTSTSRAEADWIIDLGPEAARAAARCSKARPSRRRLEPHLPRSAFYLQAAMTDSYKLTLNLARGKHAGHIAGGNSGRDSAMSVNSDRMQCCNGRERSPPRSTSSA